MPNTIHKPWMASTVHGRPFNQAKNRKFPQVHEKSSDSFTPNFYGSDNYVHTTY